MRTHTDTDAHRHTRALGDIVLCTQADVALWAQAQTDVLHCIMAWRHSETPPPLLFIDPNCFKFIQFPSCLKQGSVCPAAGCTSVKEEKLKCWIVENVWEINRKQKNKQKPSINESWYCYKSNYFQETFLGWVTEHCRTHILGWLNSSPVILRNTHWFLEDLNC